eukprot:scaffold106088_cov13-Prasinocladus_malaysianus.AAC.1
MAIAMTIEMIHAIDVAAASLTMQFTRPLDAQTMQANYSLAHCLTNRRDQKVKLVPMTAVLITEIRN